MKRNMFEGPTGLKNEFADMSKLACLLWTVMRLILIKLTSLVEIANPKVDVVGHYEESFECQAAKWIREMGSHKCIL